MGKTISEKALQLILQAFNLQLDQKFMLEGNETVFKISKNEQQKIRLYKKERGAFYIDKTMDWVGEILLSEQIFKYEKIGEQKKCRKIKKRRRRK